MDKQFAARIQQAVDQEQFEHGATAVNAQALAQ